MPVGMRATLLCLAMVSTLALLVQGDDFPKLDEALPKRVNISTIFPVFDFDGDGCYPSAAISRSGQQNHGLKSTGRMTGLCRNDRFLDLSNAYHRHACAKRGAVEYCGHSFALYMLKDQKLHLFGGGHRHEFVYAIVWTKNGTAQHVTYSDDRLKTVSMAELQKQNGHPMFVYQKHLLTEHWLRPARDYEHAENAYKMFVLPTVVSWFTMKGDNATNEQLHKKFFDYDCGSDSRFMHLDGHFQATIDLFKPVEFPEFPPTSANDSV